MARNNETLFFAGSIPDAVAAAQRSSKLFLVFIADGGEQSTQLERITWCAPQVVSLVLEKFVAVRLVHGSVDALHFSALYPVSGVPSITVIGHEGVKIWQHEGLITPEELLGKLQQNVDIFQLQLQQAAARAMAAIFALQTTAASTTVPPSPNIQTNTGTQIVADVTSKLEEQREGESRSKDDEQSAPTVKSDAVPIDTISNHQRPQTSTAEGRIEVDSGRTASTAENIDQVVGEEMKEPEPNISNQTSDPLEEVKACVLEKPLTEETTAKSTSPPELKPLKIPDKIQLQVKLTDGAVIRGEFEKSDDLWTVKTFVDANRTDGNAQYGFAVPFPRRIFNAEDYEKALVDLDIGYRAVLILVPSSDSKLAKSPSKPSSPTAGVGRWLSYLNPLSYVRSGTASPSERPKSPPSLAASRPVARETENAKSPASTKRASTSWGSNVHTLRHDEDDDVFKKGNTYWNGNATQFGANDDDHK